MTDPLHDDDDYQAADYRGSKDPPKGPCCRVRKTLSIGPPRTAALQAFRQLWEQRTPLEFHDSDCGGDDSDGLLAINFISFVTSLGDFETATRDIEIAIVQPSARVEDRTDVFQVILFKGTVASFFQQYEGGFPLPTGNAGGQRMELRTRVTADGAGARWSFQVGLMDTKQNSF